MLTAYWCGMDSWLVTPTTRNFTWDGPDNVPCQHTGLVRPSAGLRKLLEDVQALRDWWEAPLTLTSCYRRPEWNATFGIPDKEAREDLLNDYYHYVLSLDELREQVELEFPDAPMGASNSQHLLNDDPSDERCAGDFIPSLLSPRATLVSLVPQAIEILARKAAVDGFTGIGLYGRRRGPHWTGWLHLDHRKLDEGAEPVIWDEREKGPWQTLTTMDSLMRGGSKK